MVYLFQYYLLLILRSFLDSLLNLTFIDLICPISYQPKCLSVYLVVSSAVHQVFLVLSLWWHISSLPPEVRCSCVICFGQWNVSKPCITPGQKLLKASTLICHLSFPLCKDLGSINMNYQPGWFLNGSESTVPSPPTPPLTGQIASEKNCLTSHWNFRILLVQYNLTLTSLKSVN